MYITLIINIYAIQFNSARSVFTSASLDRVTNSAHDTWVGSESTKISYAKRWQRGLVGRNHPAEAIPFGGMVRRYLIIYIANLLLLTNECQQCSSTDYALGVANNTSHILATIAHFSRLLGLRFGSTLACARETSSTVILSVYAWFYPSCCWTKIAPPAPTCNSPFTHNSCVMNTIICKRSEFKV